MKIEVKRWFGGANIWAACPILEVKGELLDARSWPPERRQQTALQLQNQLERNVPSDGDELLRLARLLGQALVRVQQLAGLPVCFTAAHATQEPGHFLIAVECEAEPLGLAAVEIVGRLWEAVVAGSSFSRASEVVPLRELNYARFPPNRQTVLIYEGARELGIPVTWLNKEYRSYLRLGQGSKQQRSRGSEPNVIGAVALRATTDKYLSKQLLRSVGAPVPEGRLVSSAEEAWAVAEQLGLPVITKPTDSCLATGVSLDLKTREQVEQGFAKAQEHSSEVLVERFAPGFEHRVLVAGDRVAAVARIEPANVIGDGKHTVAELVAQVNADPRRGDGDAPLRKIIIDEVADSVLARQGGTWDTIPPAGQMVLLRRDPPYINYGGNLVDVTDRIHPRNAAHAVAAAQALQVRLAGLDVVARDISRPLEEQGGVIVEVNVSPGLWLHLEPWCTATRPIGRDIARSLFPDGSDGRIPVMALLGDSDGSVARQLARVLIQAGLRYGFSVPGRAEVAGRSWTTAAQTPLERATVLMQFPSVDVAILETDPDELLQSGFGNDRCDAVILAGAAKELDPTGQRDFLKVLRNALGASGRFVVRDPEWLSQDRLSSDQVCLVVEQSSASVPSGFLESGGWLLQGREAGIELVRGTEERLLLGFKAEVSNEADRSAVLLALGATTAAGLRPSQHTR